MGIFDKSQNSQDLGKKPRVSHSGMSDLRKKPDSLTGVQQRCDGGGRRTVLGSPRGNHRCVRRPNQRRGAARGRTRAGAVGDTWDPGLQHCRPPGKRGKGTTSRMCSIPVHGSGAPRAVGDEKQYKRRVGIPCNSLQGSKLHPTRQTASNPGDLAITTGEASFPAAPNNG